MYILKVTTHIFFLLYLQCIFIFIFYLLLIKKNKCAMDQHKSLFNNRVYLFLKWHTRGISLEFIGPNDDPWMENLCLLEFLSVLNHIYIIYMYIIICVCMLLVLYFNIYNVITKHGLRKHNLLINYYVQDNHVCVCVYV